MEKAEKVENFTSEAFLEVLAKLTPDQIRYVVARQEFATNKEAADAVDITPRTVYGWGDDVREAVRLMALDGVVIAQHIRRRALAKAMLIKTGGLDSDSETTRQKAATEIIEWELGRASQPQTHSGPDGGPMEITNVELTDTERAAGIDAIFDAARARRDRQDGEAGLAEDSSGVPGTT